jgi:hypothetical protein
MILFADPALAIFHQTGEDLAVLEDRLRYELDETPGLQTSLLPMLVAPPKHLWSESKSDFSVSVESSLRRIFPEPGQIIYCVECYTNRLSVSKDQKTTVANGEISLAELHTLRENKNYSAAKSLAVIEETTSGVMMRIIDVRDGSILFLTVADATQDLNDAKPYMGLAKELERRRQGEPLSYVFLNFGVYPHSSAQIEWMEQWGSNNQHLSGLGISILNPNIALGAVYRYMIPKNRRFNVGVALYYPLESVVSTGENSNPVGSTVLQLSVQYAVSTTFGIFSAVSTQGNLSVGVNMYNPVLMPFLL